jgi:hypothetical protein
MQKLVDLAFEQGSAVTSDSESLESQPTRACRVLSRPNREGRDPFDSRRICRLIDSGSPVADGGEPWMPTEHVRGLKAHRTEAGHDDGGEPIPWIDDPWRSLAEVRLAPIYAVAMISIIKTLYRAN